MSVMVFIEQREGNIQNVSLELLGRARGLAKDLNTDVSAIVIGDKVAHMSDELIACGADEVITIEDEMLKVYTTECYTKALCAGIKEYNPDVVLVGATTIGRDLGPRVSARIETGLTADCTSLEIDEETKNLLMTRPAFGGNIMATIICPDHSPQMSTVRPGVMQKLEKDSSRTGTVSSVEVKFEEEDMNIDVMEIIKSTGKKVNIEDANILISAGRGIGSKENLEALYDLAEKIGAEVSASRAVIDAGWVDKARQVGQTGKTVRPEVYIACGISGAIQHVAGMEESEHIIAINTNPDAPIFEVADVGIVGDANKVIKEVINGLCK